MIIEPKDVEDAEDGTEFRLGAFPNPSLDDCPITFLGFYGPRIVFGMPEGEIRDEKAADVGRLIRVDLFNSAAGQSFLANWRDGDDKFQRELACVWFVRQCREAGYWDKSRPQRSLGVWPGEHGAIVLHRGLELWTYDADGGPPAICTIAEALRRKSGPIYRLRNAAPAPEAPSDVAVGRWIRDRLDLWRFEAIGDDGLTGADLLAGWLMCALLGAVAPFRPHMLLYAMAGAGKTSLIRFVHGLLSALAGDVIDSFTAAGFRNDLAGMARPVILDEVEASPGAFGPGPVELALELIRRMATGEGAVKKQGDIGGGAVTQTAVGAVLMAAVNPVRLGSADASRIAEAKLSPLNAPPAPGETPKPLATDADLAELFEKAKALAPGLLGRALLNAGRYKADVAALKAAFVRQGLSLRASDLVAGLAAGRLLLMFDEPLDVASADEEARFWAGFIDSRDASENVSNPGQDCLAHLFSAPSGKHSHDRILNIGEIIRRCAEQAVGEDLTYYGDLLKEFGLKVSQVRDEEDGVTRPLLLVAHNHPALERIFERTNWRDWRRTLPYLSALGAAYATRPGNKQRFGMIESRSTAVPLSPWLGTVRSEAFRERSGQAYE